MPPGIPERATHDYKRHGTSSLYAALDLTTGKVIGKLHSRHRAIEFKKFLQTVDRSPAQTSMFTSYSIIASTHKTPVIKRLAARSPAVRPSPSLDLELLAEPLVERWFGELTTKKLRRGTHTSVRALNPTSSDDRDLERRSRALRVDEDRRPDPRSVRPLLHNNKTHDTSSSLDSGDPRGPLMSSPTAPRARSAARQGAARPRR